ncbi:hypothetical protein Lal_00016120 [Lupinus albus]|nr:hypothetical protein Lal_00016120 [Lupinus albus]
MVPSGHLAASITQSPTVRSSTHDYNFNLRKKLLAVKRTKEEDDRRIYNKTMYMRQIRGAE